MKKQFLALAAAAVLSLGLTSMAYALDVSEGQVASEGDIASITSIAGHPVSEPFDIIYPTCTEKGRALFKCEMEEISDHDHYVYIAAEGHEWASEAGDDAWGIVDKEPSCTEEGQAHDVCLVCGEENWDVTRVIEKLPHTYDVDFDDLDTYDVKVEPTCTKLGIANPQCIVCGFVNTAKEAEVPIPMIPHNYTEWTISKDPTCAETGYADRTCIWCNAHQRLDEDHQDRDQEFYDDNLRMLNEGWSKEAILDGTVDAEVILDWNNNCYEHVKTYSCAYCHGEIHDDIVGDPEEIVAHIWSTVPDEELSVAPTCTKDGKNVYKCIYDDGEKDANWAKKHADDPDYKVKVEKLPALGHDWTEWETILTYKKDGKEYVQQLRECNRCHATGEQVVEASAVEPEPDKKDGLVLEEDGFWRLYDEDVFQEDFTGIYDFDGGRFFVTNGVKDTADGLNEYPAGTWYFLSQGQIQTQYTGLALYDGEWFYITAGQLDTSKDGLVDYDGSKFLVSEGHIRYDVNGLYESTDGWYYLANGQAQTQYTGLVQYDGAWFYVVNGKLASDFSGTVEYDGASFEVVNGEVVA